jgi:hypothetical protein
MGIWDGVIEVQSSPSFPLLDRKRDDHKTKINEGLFFPHPERRGVGGEENLQKIKTLLDTADINTMTPIQAMQLLIKMSELKS